MIVKALKTNQNPLPITDAIQIEDSVLENRLNLEIAKIIIKAYKHKKKDSLLIPPLMDSILEARGKRFGLVILARGFARTPENYTNQVIKEFGIALLSMGVLCNGYILTIPKKCNSEIHAMIVDAKNNEVVFYRHILNMEWHPLNDKVLKDQIFRMFNGYFYKVYI